MSKTPQERRLTAGQMAALHALPDGPSPTLDVANLKVPASNYVDPELFEREKRAIFTRGPVAAGPSGLLPEKNSFHRVDIFGKPVLLTRAGDGVVRAFINVCRHRGTILCPSHDTARSKKIVCPYHAWTYSLEGQLVGVPRAETFGDFNRDDFALTPLPCKEAGGIIWIGTEPNADIDFSEVDGDLAAELEAIGLDQMRVFDKKTYPVKANWKLVMDTMLDSYHVIRLHKDTLAKYFVDTQGDITTVGPHIRSTSGRGNFTQAAVTDQFKDVRRIAVFSYALYPAGVIVVSPDYVNIGILRPISYEETAVDYYMVSDRAFEEAKMADKLRRSFDLMDKAFGQEDFWAAELGQEGLSAGSLEEMTLGGMELQMRLFHDIITGRVEAFEKQAPAKVVSFDTKKTRVAAG